MASCFIRPRAYRSDGVLVIADGGPSFGYVRWRVAWASSLAALLAVGCQYAPTYSGSKCASSGKSCPDGYKCDDKVTPPRCSPLPSTSRMDGGLTEANNGTSGTGGSAATGNGTGGTAMVGTGGMPGAGGYSGAGTALVPNGDGWIARSTNVFGIQGAWYVFSDGTNETGATSDCVNGGHPANSCTKIASPAPGTFPNIDGRMCFMGTLAAVINSDFTHIWGATMALDFNYDPNQNPHMQTLNAVANGLKGIKFDLEGASPPYGLRVGFATPATQGIGPPYWGATAGYKPSPATIGTNIVYLSQVVDPTGTVGFDPTMLIRLEVVVPTSTDGPAPFNFCISNVSGLTK